MSKRIFIAIDLKHLNLNIHSENKNIIFFPHDNYHVTLSFLGQLEEEEIELLEHLLGMIVLNYSPFEILLTQLGRFNNIIWIGVSKVDVLMKLQDNIFEILKANNFPLDEKPYLPHLSIGKIRGEKLNLNEISFSNVGPIAISEICIFRSQTGPPFPLYRIERKFKLRGEVPLSRI
ncbi:MAG: RNA 2',3'-cyclic phosphodiesterase [Bacteriovoracaceae bacterium]